MASSLRAKKGERGRAIGRPKGEMNTKLHAICDAVGRPLRMFLTAGQVSDYRGAQALSDALPAADWLLADRGYDTDWFRETLQDKKIRSCIPGRNGRRTPINTRQASRPPAEPDRDHVRPSQGLATSRDTLRQKPGHLPLVHRPRRHRHLLAMNGNES